MKNSIKREDYNNWKTYKEDIEEGKRRWLTAGWKLKQIRDNQAHKLDGYKDFKEFLEANDTSEQTAYSLIRIIETFQLTDYNALESFPISWNRAQKILPIIKSNPNKKSEIIEIAKEVKSDKELIQELAIYRKQKPHQTVETEKYIIISVPADIQLIREGLQKLSQLEGKTEIEVLIDLIQERLEKQGKAVEKKDKELNKQAKTFADLFCQKFQKYCGCKYMFQGAKDMQLVKKIMQHFSLEQLDKALNKFFTAKGNDKWWRGAPSIGIFYASIHDWVAREIKPKGKYDDIMEQAMKEAEQDN